MQYSAFDSNFHPSFISGNYVVMIGFGKVELSLITVDSTVSLCTTNLEELVVMQTCHIVAASTQMPLPSSSLARTSQISGCGRPA